MSNPLSYTVGWICAITVESVAAQAFLDEKHPPLSSVDQNDGNIYILGKMGNHNIVIAALPEGEYGTVSAAMVARDMLRTFPNVRIGLMVGIGGGAPTASRDIRLGDIVVSSRGSGDGSTGGVFQYDFGKTIQNQSFHCTGFLNQPPALLRNAVGALKAQHELDGHHLNEDIVEALQKIKRRQKYSQPPPTADKLFKPDTVHPHKQDGSCAELCGGDDPANLVSREERHSEEDFPVIHYGVIASGNSLMKDAYVRDKLASEKGILCFEMEAAGLMNHFSCLVIRGICDYSDSHKSKIWQGYAAMAAAAYAKSLLSQITPSKIETERPLIEAISNLSSWMNDIQQSTNTMENAIDSMKKSSETDRIHKWLSPSDPSADINQASSLRQPGTGTWLIQHPAFKNWLDGARISLWIHGPSGTGKTVLSTAVLQRLEEVPNSLVLSFYFDFRSESKKTLENMVRSLTFQAYLRGNGCASPMDILYESHNSGGKQPSSDTVFETLCDLLKSQDKTFIVLDALDECTSRPQLIQWINQVASRPELASLNIIYFSRTEYQFSSLFPTLIGEKNCIKLEEEAVNTDIRVFVKEKTENSPEFVRWAKVPSVLEQIRETIGSKCGGMFRWAACQLESLKVCLDREAVEETLNGLPKDLNETYERILQSIPPDRKDKTMRLLLFLVQSDQPLQLNEAVDLLAIRMKNDCGSFSKADRLPDQREISGFGGSLITVIRNNRDIEILQLAHFSVKEFLLGVKAYEISAAKASIGITRITLAYLRSIEAEWKSELTDYWFAKQAMTMFLNHAKVAEESYETRSQILDFLLRGRIFWLWIRLLGGLSEPSTQEQLEKEPSPLYFASYNGMLHAVNALISNGLDVNEPGGWFGNALHAAACNGHDGVVRALLNAKADVAAEGGKFGTALNAASHQGHLSTVKILLSQGAPVDQRAPKGGWGCFAPLLSASSKGHIEVVRELLDCSADVNINGEGRETALQLASQNGNEKLVQLLLNRGADINMHSHRHGTALYAAASLGHQGIVKILVQHGADASIQGFSGGPLHIAASRGHLAIVQLLLNSNAGINAFDKDGKTALQLATGAGHEEVVRQLLMRGADLTSNGVTDAVVCAASKSHSPQVLNVLLENGVVMGEENAGFGKSLTAAASVGHYEIVKSILAKGVDPDVHRISLGVALQAASSNGWKDIVELLLDNGSDVNAQSDEHGNSLQAAIKAGHIEIVQVLLRRGIDINAHSTHSDLFSNALQAAGYYRKKEITRLLLDHGADPQASIQYPPLEGGFFLEPARAQQLRGSAMILELILDSDQELPFAQRSLRRQQLAVSYLLDGKSKQACQLLEETQERLNQELPEDNETRLAYELTLCEALLNEDRLLDALPLLKHIRQVVQTIWPRGDPRLLKLESDLIEASIEEDDFEYAIEVGEDTVRALGQTRPEDDHFRLRVEERLSCAYINLDDLHYLTKAISLLEHVMAMRRKHNHHLIHHVRSGELLAEAYDCMERTEDAVELLESLAELGKDPNRTDTIDMTDVEYQILGYLLDLRKAGGSPERLVTKMEYLAGVEREELSSHDWGENRLRIQRMDVVKRSNSASSAKSDASAGSSCSGQEDEPRIAEEVQEREATTGAKVVRESDSVDKPGRSMKLRLASSSFGRLFKKG